MTGSIEIEYAPPTAEEHIALRTASGLGPHDIERVRAALPRSILAVTLRDNGRAIGMGRVVGDGTVFLQVVDIAVLPDYQGCGLGKRIMSALMGRLAEIAPAGAYVSLIADVPANRLYEQFGFADTAPVSLGMARLL